MNDCIFCKIVEGTLPSRKVFESERVLAYHDIKPAAPIHVLIIPKKHYASLNEASGEDFAVIGEIFQAAQQIAKELGVAESGYRIVTNCGPNAGQEVFHLHYHMMAGARLAPLSAAH